MKYISIIASLFLLISGCEGPEGPPGPRGIDAQSNLVVEFSNIDFTAPNFEVLLDVSDIETPFSDTDVVLVFFLIESFEENGEIVEEIWRPLPMQIFHPNGLLNYNFDFAIDNIGVLDINLFLDANFDLNTLTAIDTDDWIARVVIVPGDFADARIDLSDYNAVKEFFNLPELPKRSQTIKRRPVN